MTDSWGIAVFVLGCPAILGLLLMVLTALEDSLYQPAPPLEELSPQAQTAPNPVPGAVSR